MSYIENVPLTNEIVLIYTGMSAYTGWQDVKMEFLTNFTFEKKEKKIAKFAMLLRCHPQKTNGIIVKICF